MLTIKEKQLKTIENYKKDDFIRRRVDFLLLNRSHNFQIEKIKVELLVKNVLFLANSSKIEAEDEIVKFCVLFFLCCTDSNFFAKTISEMEKIMQDQELSVSMRLVECAQVLCLSFFSFNGRSSCLA